MFWPRQYDSLLHAEPSERARSLKHARISFWNIGLYNVKRGHFRNQHKAHNNKNASLLAVYRIFYVDHFA